MKSKLWAVISVLLVVGGLVAWTSCSPRQKTKSRPPDVEYYTCTMHPSVKKYDPDDKCPICKMDLVSVKKKGAAPDSKMPMASKHAGHDHGGPSPPASAQTESAEQPTEFSVPLERQQQIGVTYTVVTRHPLRRPIRAIGSVAYDRQRHWDFVSRVDGFVEKLEIGSRGEQVEKNQPLLTIYSPDLRTTMAEYLKLIDVRDRAKQSESSVALENAEQLLASARRRLLLWNITEQQINEIEEKREARDTLTLYSPFKGVVQDLRVNQGQRVMVGDHLVDVADLAVVWIWADFYQDELSLLKQGTPVTIALSAYSDQKFTGKITIVDPFLNEATRTGRVRIDVENPDLKLRPDMYVNVFVEVDLGEALAIPVQAVMPTGERTIVFVDKGEGKLEPRFVQLGRPVGDFYPVVRGLNEGERVVSSANFLIDAEAKVQGALKSW